MHPIYVQIDNDIGSIIASEIYLNNAELVKCDGHSIQRTDYPELFTLSKNKQQSMKLPNYENIFNGEIHFYIKVKK